MRLVLIGAPGSGKGTQAERLKTALGVPHVSTGAMLRAAVKADSPVGRKARAVMNAGRLVSDDIMLGVLEERLAQPDAQRGFILDGYPRNLAQVEALDALLARLATPLDAVVKLEVPNAVIVGRTEIRFKAEGRADDHPDTVRERLAIYAEQTAPVAGWYERHGMLRVVDGVGALDEVSARIQAVLPGDRVAARG